MGRQISQTPAAIGKLAPMSSDDYTGREMISAASGSPGGTYDIELFERLIRVQARGVWDGDAAADFIRAFKEAAAALGPGEWGVFFDLRGWELAVPQALEYLEELGEWTAPQGSGDHVFLLDGGSVQEAVISRLLSVSSHTARFFTNPGECREWIEEEFPGIDGGAVIQPLESGGRRKTGQ